MEMYKVAFNSRGSRCDAWLLLPNKTEASPVVIMAHGFGAEKNFGLLEFAERFVEEGIAILLFDYRHFGGSEGKPKNLVHPFRQREDWKAALSYVRSSQGLDSDRIGLWGTSYSGGHVLEIASQDPNIAVVIAQVPFLDGFATMQQFSILFSLRGVVLGVIDILKELIYKKYFRVPIVGFPQEFALINTPESYSGYMALVPENSEWKNLTPARSALYIPFNRPIKNVSRINCPVLVVKAEKDSLIPSEIVDKATAKIPNAHLVSLDAGHFDLYQGSYLEKNLYYQIKFLKEYLIK